MWILNWAASISSFPSNRCLGVSCLVSPSASYRVSSSRILPGIKNIMYFILARWQSDWQAQAGIDSSRGARARSGVGCDADQTSGSSARGIRLIQNYWLMKYAIHRQKHEPKSCKASQIADAPTRVHMIVHIRGMLCWIPKHAWQTQAQLILVSATQNYKANRLKRHVLMSQFIIRICWA